MNLRRSGAFLVRTALVTVGAAVLVACSDAGGGSGKTTLDPARADELAHASIPSERDLPGKGWEVSKTDEFNDDDEIGDTAPCNNIEVKLKKQKAANDAARAGRAEKEFTRSTGDLDLDTSVEVEVSVFRDTKTPSQAFATFKDALKGGDFGKCLEDGFRQGADAGVSITVNEGKPRMVPPSDGAARAYDLTVAAQGIKVDFRFETYLWRYGNVGTIVTITGPASEVTPGLVKAVLDRTVALLEGASKK